MAELRMAGGGLVLHLSGPEKAEAVHGDTPRGVRVRLAGAPGTSGSSAAQIQGTVVFFVPTPTFAELEGGQ